MPRTLAIGDVHGCLSALDALLKVVQPKPADTVVTLGDYIDRGPDSKGVLDRVIHERLAGNWVCLRGNHELMMLAARASRAALSSWLYCGGEEALLSYGTEADPDPSIADVPEYHWHFLRHVCVDYHETDTHIFVHAGLEPHKAMSMQISEFLHWQFLEPKWFKPHMSGKTMVCGHSEQRDGVPLVIDGAVGIDTWAYGGGWLTCLDVESGQYWQANDRGESREGRISQA